jgi:hypothetical protein
LVLLLSTHGTARAEEAAAPFHRRAAEAASAMLERAREAASTAIAATGAAARDPVRGPPMIAAVALLTGIALGAGLARRRVSVVPNPRPEPVPASAPPQPTEAPAASDPERAEAEPAAEPQPTAQPMPLADDPPPESPRDPFAAWSPDRVALVGEVMRILEEEAQATAAVEETPPQATEPKPEEVVAAA